MHHGQKLNYRLSNYRQKDRVGLRGIVRCVPFLSMTKKRLTLQHSSEIIPLNLVCLNRIKVTKNLKNNIEISYVSRKLHIRGVYLLIEV